MSFGRPGRCTSPAEMTDVTPPCSPDSMKLSVCWRGVKSPNTGWAWESMSPGSAVAPLASIVWSRSPPAPAPPSSPRPIAAIRSSSIRIESASAIGASMSPVTTVPMFVMRVRIEFRPRLPAALEYLVQPVLTDCVLGLEPAHAGVRPAAVGDREREQQLVGGRRVGNPDLHRVEVRAHEHRLDVVDRDVEGGAHRAALLDRGQDRDPADTGPRRRPELRVQAGGDLLELARLAHDAALAVGLDRCAERFLSAAGQLVAEVLAEVDELGEVVAVLAGVGILDHDGDGGLAQRPREGLAALLVDLLDERRPLPDRHGHADTSSDPASLAASGGHAVEDGSLDVVEWDAVLGHRIAIADRGRAVLQGLDVDRDAPRRADLVLAPIQLADRRGVVVDRHEVFGEIVAKAVGQLDDLGPLLEQRQDGHLVRRELRVQAEDDAG